MSSAVADSAFVTWESPSKAPWRMVPQRAGKSDVAAGLRPEEGPEARRAHLVARAESARAGPQGIEDVAALSHRGQDEDAQIGVEIQHLPHSWSAADPFERRTYHDCLWLIPRARGIGLLERVRLADELELAPLAYESGDTLDEDEIVVGDYHAEWLRAQRHVDIVQKLRGRI